MDGKQGGDPAKLAAALVGLAALDEPPARFAADAGADAVATFEQEANELLIQVGTYRVPRPAPTASCLAALPDDPSRSCAT